MRDRKAPYRPRTDNKRAAEGYNDGVVDLYAVSDEAPAGLLPREALRWKERLCYQERKLGIRRYYDARQNQIHVERVIRIPKPPIDITNQDVAITEDGRRYRIDLVQELTDVWPRSLDLTLASYSQGVIEIQPIPPVEQEGGDGDA